jgi:hypothetical protein
MELTNKQDEMINDERQNEDNDDNYYSDWLGDNISQLRKDFIEDHNYEQEFLTYCKEAFRDEMENKA